MVNSVYSFMRTRTAKTFIQPHAHDRHEFVYFFSGKGTLTIENTNYTFAAGSYYFLTPETTHSELYENTGKSLVLWFNLPENTSISSIVQDNTKLNLDDLSTQIRQELKTRLYGYDLIVDAITAKITVLIGRQQNSKTVNTGYGLQNTLAYIDEYYMTSIKISELAEQCGYSVDHYRVLFKNLTKLNPKDYILAKRLKLAKNLLGKTSLSIAEICRRCGFEYYSQFMKFFTSHIGVTPTEYRKSLPQRNTQQK